MTTIKNDRQRKENVSSITSSFAVTAWENTQLVIARQRNCVLCAEQHHTSLHDALRKAPVEANVGRTALSAYNASRRSSVLLATARVTISDRFGNPQEARALIDQGSEATIVSERLAQRLRLPRQRASVMVIGVGGQRTGVARGRISLRVSSRSGDCEVTTTALVLPRLTGYTNPASTTLERWSHLRDLDLADPDLNHSTDPVDILLGADIYPTILLEELRKGTQNQPIAQKTIFGWILSGKIQATGPDYDVATHQCNVAESLSELVRSFWEQEEWPSSSSSLTPEEQECEDLFALTHTRNPDGRYIVRLPLRRTLLDLSETRVAAERSLKRTENRFLKEPTFRQLYTEFMGVYEELQHMSRLDPATHNPRQMCYLHHGVLRESSVSTRLRVVFNGSSLTSSGISLNQHLLVGRNLLPALQDILLRWRWHRFVLTSDVEKMYRQILVHETDPLKKKSR